MNFAAESHVDRSIHSPAEFVETNIIGTFNLLECARAYWKGLQESQQKTFAFTTFRPMRSMDRFRWRPLTLGKQALLNAKDDAGLAWDVTPKF